jgi:hypothetical protein
MNEYWFRPKTYGYGATPVTWEGWVVVVAYVLVAGIGGPVILRDKAFFNWLSFFSVIAIATAVMIAVSVKKTDGPWHWQWGPENSGKAN